MMRAIFDTSIPGRAQSKGVVDFHYWNLRDFGTGSYHSVDDYPFGGGGGMVLKPEPIAQALDCAIGSLMKLGSGAVPLCVYPSPQGKVFRQDVAWEWARSTRPILFLCGHYEGIDQRVLDSYDLEEWSAGDYVLSGGELPAALMVDAVVRLVPGVLSNQDSPFNETFSNGSFDFPQYTRPRSFRGMEVPPVLLSGDHRAVQTFRDHVSRKKQQDVRPDLNHDRSPSNINDCHQDEVRNAGS
jgi:tRNA (guanine37-N1)-methyltransferase